MGVAGDSDFLEYVGDSAMLLDWAECGDCGVCVVAGDGSVYCETVAGSCCDSCEAGYV